MNSITIFDEPQNSVTWTRINKYTIHIYDENNNIISRGSILIDIKPEGKPAGLIEDIWTSPDHRRKGYATQVMKKIEEIARKNNCYKMVLICSDINTQLYSKCGFHLHQNGMRKDL